MLFQLKLRDFRCFESLSLEFGSGASAFVGRNAQGKTSILEAVCVLLRLQSPRASKSDHFVRIGAQGFFVEGEWNGVPLQYSSAGTRKRLAADGSVCRKRADYLASSGLVVWMGNTDLELVRGSGENRRRFLDFAASQLHAGYGEALRNYDRALRARNFLFKRDARPDWKSIDAYTQLLVEHGKTLTEQRADLASVLQPLTDEAYRQISLGECAPVGLRYMSGAGDGDFEHAFENSREEDARRRQTTVGPHRDDLEIQIGEMPASQFASEGQQRSIALAMKLAQANVLRELRNQSPILLVDDIFGELDPPRRNALFSAFPADSQKLLTTTHLDWADEAVSNGLKIFEVSGGRVSPE
ncbi:MAG: DNA replication and repair protein RecF [Verrucomicrobiota bacterium]